MKKYLFIINPVAGGRAGKKIRQDLSAEIKKNIPTTEYDLLLTGPGEIGFPAADYDVVVVAGGDGTVGKAVQTLARRETRPKLGIIPVGTGNDLARSLGICALMNSRGVAGLLVALRAGRSRLLDVLSLNRDIFFTNYCGIGIDARIAAAFNAGRAKSRMPGKILYFLLGLKNLPFSIPCPVTLHYQDTSLQDRHLSIPQGARQIILTNIPSYAGGAQPSSDCRMDDGLFEVTVIRTAGHWLLLHMTRFFKKPFDLFLPGIIRIQTPGLEIACNGTLPCQLDGETLTGCRQPLSITLAAQFEVVVP